MHKKGDEGNRPVEGGGVKDIFLFPSPKACFTTEGTETTEEKKREPPLPSDALCWINRTVDLYPAGDGLLFP
jgi:hypothetical protein